MKCVKFSSQDLKELSGLVTEFSLLVHVSTNNLVLPGCYIHFSTLHACVYLHMCTATPVIENNVTEAAPL